MNRKLSACSILPVSVPHACGDEPAAQRSVMLTISVFPTHVGMNRVAFVYYLLMGGVPHACGDEPLRHYIHPQDSVFPTHVGMNRHQSPASAYNHVFPTHVGMNRLNRSSR